MPPGPREELTVSMLRRPLDGAAGLADRRRRLVAGDDFVHAIEVFRIVLALRLRLADKRRGHQLMVALAIIDLVRLQLDVVRQLEILQGGRELDRIEALLAV